MKKFSVILSAILILCISVVFSACGGAELLSTPANFYVDDDDNLNWSDVEDARSYEIEITDAEGVPTIRTSRRAFYGLRTLAEGDYGIRVRATGAYDAMSEWSETFRFHKLPESEFVYRATDDGLAWTLWSARTVVGDIVLEDTYRGKPVISISGGAFRNDDKVTSVAVGKNVRTIGERAFYNCTALVSVSMPDEVSSFGNSVFYNCTALEAFTLPASLEAIPDYTFAYCISLRSIPINDKIKSIGKSAFYNCLSFTEVSVPDSVELIDEYAFSFNTGSDGGTVKLSSVTLGAGLEQIGKYAFYNNSALRTVTFAEEYDELTIGESAFRACGELTECTLPEGILTIPEACFYDDVKYGAEGVRIPDSVTDIGYRAYTNTALTNAQDGQWTYADRWLISVPETDCNELTELTPASFHEDTVGIAAQVFFTLPSAGVGCTQLSKIELPKSLKYVGELAFGGCTALNRLTLERGTLLEIIGMGAFLGCSFLSNVQLSNRVGTGYESNLRSIESYAFYGCTSLDDNEQAPEWLTPRSLTHIGQYAFLGSGTYASTENDPSRQGVVYMGNWVVGYDIDLGSPTITLRSGVRGIADYSFAFADEVVSIDGVNTVRYFGEGAFVCCESLREVRVNPDVTEFRPYVFAQCKALTTIGEFSDRITSIGDFAFFQCDSLESIDLSATQVEEIAAYAFYSCGAANEIILNDKVTSIGEYAFYHNEAEAISIPDSVETIGGYAFAKSENLETLSFGEGSRLKSIGDCAFREMTVLQTAVLPDSLETIGFGAFYGCENLTDVDLGNGVRTLGAYAFAANRNLRTIILPQSLTEIDVCAFAYCSGLRSVVLPETLTSMGNYAFYGCYNTTFYTPLTEAADDWSGRWNASFRPVVWGVTLSEEGYVTGIPSSGVTGTVARGGLNGPEREGYEFLGWALSENATAADYTMSDLAALAEEMQLYAVYGPAASEPEEPVPEGPETEEPGTGEETDTEQGTITE